MESINRYQSWDKDFADFMRSLGYGAIIEMDRYTGMWSGYIYDGYGNKSEKLNSFSISYLCGRLRALAMLSAPDDKVRRIK